MYMASRVDQKVSTYMDFDIYQVRPNQKVKRFCITSKDDWRYIKQNSEVMIFNSESEAINEINTIRRERIAEENANIQRVDAQVKKYWGKK